MPLGVSVQGPPTELINRTHQSLEAAGSFQEETSMTLIHLIWLLELFTLKMDIEPFVH